MKTFETHAVAATTKPALSEPTTGQDPNADLKQRLWQLLLPLPEKPAIEELSGSKSSGPTEQQASRETRARSAASELAATAYVLAGHLQQLSLYDAARADVASAARPINLGNGHSVSVRLDATTATGGLASVEITHPELGPVELSVELANGAVRVTATTNSARSAEVIQQGQALLAQRLLHQGVALEALDVVVRKRKSARPAKRSKQRAREEES